MSQLVPIVADGVFQRNLSPGDNLCAFEPAVPAAVTTVTLSYSAAQLSSPFIVRNPAGASTDTFPTADALISALSSGLGDAPGVSNGLTWRVQIVNLAAFLLTGAVTANSGVTMTRGNVAASATKEFLVQVTNGTPLLTATNITTTNASPITTGWTAAQLAAVSVGQVVTNAVAGLQGTTIIAVNATAMSVTFSGNANATGSGNTITVSPTYTITGLAA